MDEMFLYNKLNVLQAEMLNFHERISPAKSQRNQNEPALMLTYQEENRVLNTCISVLLAVLKISVCITGPTLFPTIVYCIEGSSQLFWHATVVSGIVAVLLTMMVASMLCTSVKRVQKGFDELLNSLGNILGRVAVLRYVYNATTSDFARRNANKVLYPLVVLFSTSLVTLVAYVKHWHFIFYGSLMLISFVSGVLSTVLVNLLKSPEMIPFHSPCKVQSIITTPSPHAKRELNYSSFKKPQDDSSSAQFSTPSLSDTNYEYIETKSITAFLPNISPNIYQETLETTSYLQLPFNLSFFRK